MVQTIVLWCRTASVHFTPVPLRATSSAALILAFLDLSTYAILKPSPGFVVFVLSVYRNLGFNQALFIDLYLTKFHL